MNRAQFPIIGLAVVAAVVGWGLYMNRGSHVVLRGEIRKVRLHKVDDNSSVAILDFRFDNPADYPLVVRSAQLFLEGGKEPVEGAVVADMDAKRLLQAIPELGPKYNDSLKVRDRIPPRSSDDRMITARFEVPVADLEKRKTFRIRVEDVDGAISELTEANAAAH
jgi:hypothetical protein